MAQKPNLEQFSFYTKIQIRFADLDAFRHVNNANYLTYCEIARTAYWKKNIRWDWNKMGIIIARAEIDYKKPLTLKHQLLVYVKTAQVGTKSFQLNYLLISKQKGEVIVHAEAKTVCVCIDYNSHTTQNIPEKYKTIMKNEIETIGLLEKGQKVNRSLNNNN